jgi:hypothetical protein
MDFMCTFGTHHESFFVCNTKSWEIEGLGNTESLDFVNLDSFKDNIDLLSFVQYAKHASICSLHLYSIHVSALTHNENANTVSYSRE